MGDLQRRVERSELQWHDELVISDLFRRLRGDGDLVADTLLLDATRRPHQQDLGRLFADRIFENSFPVVPAAKAQHVCEHLIAKRGQLRAEPQREGVVFRIGVTDEQCLTHRVAHESLPDSCLSLEDLPANARRKGSLPKACQP
jgi:hypothetical protein